MADFRGIPELCVDGEVFGCTYSNANNYNSSATIDDGSCVFSNGNTFEVNTYISHYQECGSGGNQNAGFILHIPEIFAYNPVTTFDMFIKLYAYPHELGANITENCLVGGQQYIDIPFTLGNTNKFPNHPHVIHIDELTPNFAMVFELKGNDSNFIFTGTERLPVTIEIFSDGRKYTGADEIIANNYFQSVPTNNTILIQ